MITIPSTGRRDRLSDCLRSIDYTGYREIAIGAKVYSDIPWGLVNSMRNISVIFTEDAPVNIQNRLASDGLSRAHILPITDDIVFESGAITKAVDCLQQAFPGGDGIIGFDIRNMSGPNKCPYAYMLIGSTFFNSRLKRVLFNDQYLHFYADMELGRFAESLGRFRVCDAAGIRHFHPASGAPADSTHLHKRTEKWKHDNDIYEARSRELFA